jgi:hypothetical protein
MDFVLGNVSNAMDWLDRKESKSKTGKNRRQTGKMTCKAAVREENHLMTRASRA